MINLLPLRLIFIRTYERDSDKERLREDVLPRFRVLKCCDFLWTVFLRAFSFFALTLVAMLPELSSISFISASGNTDQSQRCAIRYIPIDVLKSTDRCSSIRDCCVGDRNSDCCVPLTDCCASGTDNDWFVLRTFSFFALTLVAILPESKWLSKVVFNIGVLCTSIDGESQSLETLLGEVLKFMSMDWDSLVTLLLSISFVSVSEIPTKVEDVSSVISIGAFKSTDRCSSIKDCCVDDRNSACCVPLTDCCASGTDNDWFWFCIIPLWLCEIAIWLISMLDVGVSLWRCGILIIIILYK